MGKLYRGSQAIFRAQICKVWLHIKGDRIMITLKTLPQATAQDVFDHVTQHLLKQGKRSVSSTGACQYRTEQAEGVLKCAAGCLITDDEYNSKFEGE